MNERISRLRKQSLEVKPYISLERAKLLTKFYRTNSDNDSIPIKRAKAFKYILENKEICINHDELIVGERGPQPKATPTYPEICSHSIDDFRILNSREKISFLTSKETMETQESEIIPFWQGKSIRDKIFDKVDPAWKIAYKAGVFTEFLEQRAPGHTVLDDKIYHKGLLDFQVDIQNSINKIKSENSNENLGKEDELIAMNISIEGMLSYARRYAEKAIEYANIAKTPQRKQELLKIAEICSRVPANAPQNFHEALQYYWFVHLGVITELNTWDSFNPGRLDQHLYPFYQSALESGEYTQVEMKELLQAFWIKFNNQPAPPKVGVTAQESNTYTDFCLINLGGLTSQNKDGVNELTYLILDVIEEMRLLQPSSMIQVSKKSPNKFIDRALKIIKSGFGQPSVFNTDMIIKEMLRQGKSHLDALCGGASGCVETGAFGKESYILTGYFNLVKVLEITLYNGLDPRTNHKVGIESGDPLKFESFNDLLEAFERQLNHFINIKIKGNLVIEKLWADHLPAPFMSVFIDDCIKNGMDYNNGGARYNTSYIQGVGVGTITDSLSALKYHVFEKKTIDLSNFLKILKSNFNDNSEFRNILLLNTPKYGNDDDFADDILKLVFEMFFQAVDGKPNYKKGHFRINLLPTTVHVYFGSVIGATPDGRKSGVPLSEGISPVQGSDKFGPTAVLKSAAKIDHSRTGGTLLNQKFSPQLLNSKNNLEKIRYLIRAYFEMGGHHIQFNVVSAATLRKAQKNPEVYRDLIVRVAGYSDYFIDLGKQLQDEIIQRTEHQNNQ